MSANHQAPDVTIELFVLDRDDVAGGDPPDS
jgi:hypothetical protein